MKIILEPMWFWFVNIALLLIFIYLLITYFNKDHGFTDLWSFIEVGFVIIMIVFVLSVFALGYIEIAVVSGAEEDSTMIATILNGFLMGAYLLALGFTPTLSESSWEQAIKVLAIITFGLFSIMGFGHIGLRITFTDVPLLFNQYLPFESFSDLLVYNIYQTNAHHGGMFFLLNVHLFTTIFLASFLTETEVSG